MSDFAVMWHSFAGNLQIVTAIGILNATLTPRSSMYAVFVTADPSPKALNRALLLIQDFEFGQYPEDSEWTLLTSKTLPSTAPGATTLPIPDISGNNDFVSQSLAEINTFIRANEVALERIDVSTGDWLIIDQKGLETSTCLVCEQVYYSGEDGQEGEEGLSSDFRACRLPYEEAHGMIVNLNLANMDFEEFVDEDAGEQPDGAWKWQSFDPSEGAPEGMAEEDIEREKALQKLRDGGYAD